MKTSSSSLCLLGALALVAALGAVSGVSALFAPIGASSAPLPVSQFYINQINDEVDRMRTRWATLDAACSPHAVFALTYLYMTTALRDTVTAGYYDDGERMSNFTVAFAARYSAAIDARLSGTGATPTLPWQEAFGYSESGYSSVQEDLVLGMNAHINYDLSFIVLEVSTLATKDDYDRINDVLNLMIAGVTSDLAARYDPIFTTPLYGYLNPLILEALYAMRATAWVNGMLQKPLTPLLRATAQASVLVEAMLAAQTQKTYNLGVSTAATRLAYCSTHHHPSLL